MLHWIRTIWDYNQRTNHRLWECIQTISDDDFIKPVAYSVGSVHIQIVHMMWAEAAWYARIHDFPRPTFTAEEYPARPSIRETWDYIEADWRIYLENLTDEELHRTMDVIKADGTRYTTSVLETLLHGVNHGTNHRAQILQLLHSYGGETFEQDMSFYFRERQNSSTA